MNTYRHLPLIIIRSVCISTMDVKQLIGLSLILIKLSTDALSLQPPRNLFAHDILLRLRKNLQYQFVGRGGKNLLIGMLSAQQDST